MVFSTLLQFLAIVTHGLRTLAAPSSLFALASLMPQPTSLPFVVKLVFSGLEMYAMGIVTYAFAVHVSVVLACVDTTYQITQMLR